MTRLGKEQRAEYLHRSYTAADGLWFMKVEAKYGFDAALEIDKEVWKVLPKIQARMLKSFAKNGHSTLFDCFKTKLSIDGFEFKAKKDKQGEGVTVTIGSCPWYNALIKSQRQHLAGKIGSAICGTEYAVWASEFGGTTDFLIEQQQCKGAPRCLFRFLPKQK